SQSGPIAVNTMPSGSIAVPRESALSVSRVMPGRHIPASADPEQARPPGARVSAAAVAAAVAVALAELRAVALAAHVHALDQLVAAAVKPVGAAHGRRVGAALLRLALAVLAELVVGLELVAQLAHAQLDHDR